MGSLYINNGQAGTDVTGDGIILKDMDNDGIDDYVFCDETGVLTLYFNKGPSNNGWVWVPASSAPVASGVGAKREQVRLAYIYGHGRADYGECFLVKVVSVICFRETQHKMWLAGALAYTPTAHASGANGNHSY